MVWRGDIQKHYDNVDKAYDVMNLIDEDELDVRNGIRDVIVNELVLCCECIIDWLGDETNVNSKKSQQFKDNLELGYDILLILEARTFIYLLLAKPFSDLIKVEVN